ncbi:ABC transporter substrate-binding protein [Variovorax sp. J22P168]|uniref:ABC transporter substrate-binding protein n=1 Tax=Variovorax jilinensis TaxID=3053513 RepID=UPI002575590E|nr:ABC transporter substrate-binding protein [Variovorax sp. J22P168]MDM0014858.1 ABC transporter substrate-binding protein [Variovorax sp. J22P168]
MKQQRRRLVGGIGAGVLGFMGPWQVHRAWAQSTARKPLVIGLTTDDTGQYGASGQDEQRGIRMAIAEANVRGGLLGRRIETVHADTGGDAARAAGVARRMITEQEAAFLIGGVHSGAANAISGVAQQYGCIYFNTNSSSPTEAGKDCHRVKFVWDGNSTNFSTAVVRGAMTGFGPNWVLVTSDYLWGRNTAKGIREIVERSGGKVVEELLVPQSARDFSAQLERIRQLNPSVVATAVGGDDVKALRQQVRAARMDRAFAWINNQQDWPDVYGAGPEALFGIFCTTWYWGLRLPGVQEFVERYQQFNPDYRIRRPGNVYYNGYMATRELFRAIERTGTTNNLRLIRELETLKLTARDRMQHFDAWMNPHTHQLQQTIYMAAYNTAPREPDDVYRVLAQQRPEEAEDASAAQSCKLESWAATPSYEV